jgi:tetratricopeptide (TPR) repeat protein
MFKRFVQIQPKAYEGYLNLGVAQNLQGKYDEAEPNLKKAVEIKPGDFLANADLGYLYTDKGDYAKAKVYLQKAAQIDPGDSDVQKTLSLIKSKGY